MQVPSGCTDDEEIAADVTEANSKLSILDTALNYSEWLETASLPVAVADGECESWTAVITGITMGSKGNIEDLISLLGEFYNQSSEENFISFVG